MTAAAPIAALPSALLEPSAAALAALCADAVEQALLAHSAPDARASGDAGALAPCARRPSPSLSAEVLLADALLHSLAPNVRDGLLRHLERSANPLRGAWTDSYGDTDLSTTVLAWWARHHHGVDEHDALQQTALREIHRLGGAQRAGVHVRLWLCMAGALPWHVLPRLPSWLWLMPTPRAVAPQAVTPWARAAVAAYQVLHTCQAHLHLTSPAAALVRRGDAPAPSRMASDGLLGDTLELLSQGLRLAHSIPLGRARDAAQRAVIDHVQRTQQPHGGWMDARTTLWSVLALRASGLRGDDPCVRRALAYLERARHLDADGVVVQGLRAGDTAALVTLAAAAAMASDTTRTAAPPDATPPHATALARVLRLAVGPTRAGTCVQAELGGADTLDAQALLATLEVFELASKGHIDDPDASLWSVARDCLRGLRALQDRDGSFSRHERADATTWLARLPLKDAAMLASEPLHSPARRERTARALRLLTRLGADSTRADVARGLRWWRAAVQPVLRTADTRELLVHLELAIVALPADDPLRLQLERGVLARQRDAGHFGEPAHTALAIRVLGALPHTAPQRARAHRALVEQLDGAPSWVLAQPALGVGVSREQFDLARGLLDAILALSDAPAVSTHRPLTADARPRGVRPAPTAHPSSDEAVTHA